MYNITFQQIESFLNVARSKNLSKAASDMYISQPALSKTLQRFEEGIGLKLFFRSNQGVSLTPEGEYLYSTLEPLYSNIEKTIKTANNLSSMAPKSIKIVEPSTYDVSEDFGVSKLYVKLFEEKFPDVVVMEFLADFKDLRRSLEFGDANIAITQVFAIFQMQGISYKRLSDFKLYLAIAEDHPLAAYDFPPIDKLSEETLYRVPAIAEDEDRRLTLERCNLFGFVPKNIEFVPNFATLHHKIKTQRGFSICGKFTYGGNSEEIKYFPLRGYDDTSSVVIAWRRDHLTHSMSDFINLIPGDTIEL